MKTLVSAIRVLAQNIKNDYFYRINEDGDADIFESDGTRATLMREVENVYPVGSPLSVQYEHVYGITLTKKDAEKLGLEEDANV